MGQGRGCSEAVALEGSRQVGDISGVTPIGSCEVGTSAHPRGGEAPRVTSGHKPL